MADDGIEVPSISSHLWASLNVYQREHEEQYAEPESEYERTLHDSIQRLGYFALTLIKTGVGTDALDPAFSDFMPGSNVAEKITSLLGYNLVRDQLEFAVAHSVVDRLAGLRGRIEVATLAFTILLRSQPSDTAVKYLERASDLFLSGYDGEVLVMCGAVVEAAAKERVPDDELRAAGEKPKFRRTGDFSIQQRIEYGQRHRPLSPENLKQFWEIVDWRNNAVHVQPDIGPKPMKAIIMTAFILGALLPRIH